MSNDKIEVLLRRLSPRAREVYDQIETLVERPLPGRHEPRGGRCTGRRFTRRTYSLSERTDLIKIVEARMAYVEHQGEEARRKVEKARRAAALIQRAQDLDREEGKPLNDAMSVKQAVERLREAGKLSKEDFL